MKKVKLICAIGAFFLVGMSFTACNSSTTDSKEAATQEKAQDEQTETAIQDEYKCPMACEPDKEYHEPGNCPVCEMDLRKVDS